jgi:glycine/D-amino acid oxidase-like deaminating enzyme
MSASDAPAPPPRRTGDLTRRSILAGGAASAAWLLASACSSAARRAPAARPATGRRLAPVRVAPDRVIRTVAGLRPFRPSGFRVEAVRRGEKLVVHNYGHGGGGVTLSWGTGQLAVEEVLAAGARSAAVLGCGAVGLATARLLQDRGVRVTIYARDLPPNTTSNLAGAEWWPYYVADEDRRTPAFDAQFERAARFAFRYFQNLVGERYGVRWLEAYALSDNPPHPPRPDTLDARIEDLAPQTLLSPEEHPFPVSTARRFHTMHVETSVYLFALLADFRLAGGTVVVEELADEAAVLALPEPAVVNCTGLGARALFGDAEMLPVKGQLSVLLPQPEVDYMTFGPNRLYMIPRHDGIALGGTAERGVETLEPDPNAAARILDGQRRLFEGFR